MDVTDSYRDDRYHRQTSLEAIGVDGQHKLQKARVLVVGAGGLGSPLIKYLAAAGVGHIGIVDDDTVSASNLNRQILYDISQVGKPKANCAANVVRRINPDCKIWIYRRRLTDDNALNFFCGYNVIADCTDNLATRYVIDRHTKALGIPFVHGSLCEFEGRVAVFNYKGGTSYADLFPFDADEVASFTQPTGILGAFAGVVGTIEALETVKVILGKPTLADRILLIDGLSLRFETIKTSL
jgi:hypothetical protein